MRQTHRQALLDAASRIVDKNGAAGLTLDAVAEEAGTPIQRVLYHFSSSRAIFWAILEDAMQEWDRGIEHILSDSPDAPNRSAA